MMDANTLTTIIHKHIQKGDPDAKRSVYFKEVNEYIKAYPKDYESRLLQKYNIQFPDYLEYL